MIGHPLKLGDAPIRKKNFRRLPLSTRRRGRHVVRLGRRFGAIAWFVHYPPPRSRDFRQEKPGRQETADAWYCLSLKLSAFAPYSAMHSNGGRFDQNFECAGKHPHSARATTGLPAITKPQVGAATETLRPRERMWYCSQAKLG